MKKPFSFLAPAVGADLPRPAATSRWRPVGTSWRGSAAACRSSGVAALLRPPFPHPPRVTLLMAPGDKAAGGGGVDRPLPALPCGRPCAPSGGDSSPRLVGEEEEGRDSREQGSAGVEGEMRGGRCGGVGVDRPRGKATQPQCKVATLFFIDTPTPN
jgi:hypothetical protein